MEPCFKTAFDDCFCWRFYVCSRRCEESSALYNPYSGPLGSVSDCYLSLGSPKEMANLKQLPSEWTEAIKEGSNGNSSPQTASSQKA